MHTRRPQLEPLLEQENGWPVATVVQMWMGELQGYTFPELLMKCYASCTGDAFGSAAGSGTFTSENQLARSTRKKAPRYIARRI